MRLLTGLFAGRESLVTHATALNTVADNLTNVNTTGFKSERLEFGDLLADSIGCLYSAPLAGGNGVMGMDISASHDIMGPIQPTGRDLDVAIDGRGYYILNDGTNTFYTRAGNFVTDTEGYLQSVTGQNVMGYTAASPDELVPLVVAGADGAPVATTQVILNGNLNSGSPVVADIPANPENFQALNDAATFRASVRVIDSLGDQHDIGLYFFLSDAQNRTWQVDAYVNGAEGTADAETGAEPVPVPSRIGTGTITFDENGGQGENATNQLTINPNWPNGAAATEFNIDLGRLNGFASSSFLSGVTTDGNLAGSPVGTEFRPNGEVVTHLDSGDEVVIGTIALAMFNAPTGLERVGENMYRETDLSGTASNDIPETEGRGRLAGASLENSNVDPAAQFVDMVRYQRGYQAGSQVISTHDELLNSTIQIA